jgi:hypothetical protein
LHGFARYDKIAVCMGETGSSGLQRFSIYDSLFARDFGPTLETTLEKIGPAGLDHSLLHERLEFLPRFSCLTVRLLFN